MARPAFDESLEPGQGQKACAAAFVDALRAGGPSPIPLDEILEVSRITVTLGEAAR